ncbi:O-glucosyltransferase rumi homolog [Selaginella moellendorffii]|uniref:O-glucosyltransferase rumi homolog n=1 Tax=Selaginella moellendorffii TaxID=88036 RepID=UPI000D1CC41B|nr:O-glucosyltransferase rumi homolog [Selaginella moellendorffii]|eukprot:XP_024529804.1 O-glucosyltransferase rumi homolog [Selaginella moellendorffii]
MPYQRVTMKTRGAKKFTGRHLISAVIPLSLLLCLVPTLYLISSYSSVIFYTRTLAGDNLLPTPWHHFPPARKSQISWSRAHKIFECSYLSCAAPPWTAIANPAAANSSSQQSCPDFFQWIHHDLAPWRASGGISRAALEEAREFAAFRVAIIGGQLYAELYYQCVQSRAMFTLWGLLLLLERFPAGAVPDVEFMFNCMDRPHFRRSRYKSRAPPPLLAYCGSRDTVDIAFPDWSFWGW